MLLRFNPSTEPILRLALSSKTSDGDSDAAQLTALRRYADDDLKKKLEPVDGVAAVKVGGGLEDEIQVDIDQQKLAQLNLPIDTVIQRLQQENINISGGRLEEGSQRYLVRTVNQFASCRRDPRDAGHHAERRRRRGCERGGADGARRRGYRQCGRRWLRRSRCRAPVLQVRRRVAGGMPVRLKDIADVRQGYKEREAIIRLGGKEAVELADLQGRRRQHGGHRRRDPGAAEGNQGPDPGRRRADHHRRPVAVHPPRHQRREDGCGDRRRARRS